MAKSKYEYVREFESATDHRLLQDSFVVVRIDGQNFHRFSKEHNFLKPNDKRCLDLMNRAALHVMRSFYPNIIISYGQSDEYSFTLRRLTSVFNRRQNKITSLITSAFTAAFIFYWDEFFSTRKNENLVPINTDNLNIFDQPLKYPPTFDGRCILYPSETTLKDYLKWRQVDCHINNLYNTTFYALTGEYVQFKHLNSNKFTFQNPYRRPETDSTSKPSYFSSIEATQKLSGTSSGDKNEILFTDYGVNYNNELEQFRKGTTITLNQEVPVYQELLNKKCNERNKKKTEERFRETVESNEDKELFDVMHCDIIGENFWTKYQGLLKL